MVNILQRAALATVVLLQFFPLNVRGEEQKSPLPRDWVGLCVRTAPTGYVILEARVVHSSGDPVWDEEARASVIGVSVPAPNSRGWREWLWIAVTNPDRPPPIPLPHYDCSQLDPPLPPKS